MSKFSINLSDEDRNYLDERFSAGPTHGIRVALELMRKYDKGELQVITPSTDTKGKSKEELEKERLAVEIEIKKQVRDSNELERKKDQADLDLTLERVRKLKWENDNREAKGPLRQIPQAPAVVETIKSEIAKDTATPEPRKKPSTVRELPPGQGIVGCDNCHETFIFDNADKGLDDFLDHLKEKHPFRREQISQNEANQFRHARDRIAKGVSA